MKKIFFNRNIFQRIIFIVISAICIICVIYEYENTKAEMQNKENTEMETSAEKMSQKTISLEMLEEGEVEAEEVIPRTLEEILATPETSTIAELIPYLHGDFETNHWWLSHLCMGEGRGGTDVVLEAQCAVAVIRSFDSSASDGTGNLESAICYQLNGQYQYTCIPDGSFYQEPDEQCLRVAEAFLKGELIEPDRNLTSFFIGIAPIKGKTIENIYEVPDWRTSNPEDVMEVYVCSKW